MVANLTGQDVGNYDMKMHIKIQEIYTNDMNFSFKSYNVTYSLILSTNDAEKILGMGQDNEVIYLPSLKANFHLKDGAAYFMKKRGGSIIVRYQELCDKIKESISNEDFI